MCDAWVEISVSSTGTARTITICDSAGVQVLESSNANNTTAGNGKPLMVMGGAWVAIAH